MKNNLHAFCAGLVVEIKDAFTVLGQKELIALKNMVIPKMGRLNKTHRGFYAVENISTKKGKDEMVLLDIAKAIKEAFELGYLPGRGVFVRRLNSPSYMTMLCIVCFLYHPYTLTQRQPYHMDRECVQVALGENETPEQM